MGIPKSGPAFPPGRGLNPGEPGYVTGPASLDLPAEPKGTPNMQTVVSSPVTPWRHLILQPEHRTPPSAPPLDTVYLAIMAGRPGEPGPGAHVIANIEVAPAALLLAVIGDPRGDSTRTITGRSEEELAEDRVRAFLDEYAEGMRADGADPDVFSEGFEHDVTVPDFREVLRELEAWRALAGARLDIITRLAEELERFVDPAPQEQTGGNI